MAGYYDPSDESIVERASGTLVLRRWFFRVDIDNRRLENITQKVKRCVVRWSRGREGGAPMTIEFEWKDDGSLDYLSDYVAPVIRWEWSGGRYERTQLGLFALSLPRRVITPYGVVSTVKGRDLTWVMKNSYLTKNLNFSAGTFYDDVFRTLVQGAGINRMVIRDTQRQLSSGRTIRRNTSRGEQFNNFAKSIGWYGAQADLTGKIITLPYRNTRRVAAVGMITGRNLVGNADSPHPPSEIPNVVIVRADRSDKAPLVSIARNTDLDSPASIGRQKREVTVEYNESGLETQADADALAMQRLRDVTSYYDRLNMTIQPSIAFLGQNQRVDLDFMSGNEHYTGAWAIQGWEVGMEPGPHLIRLSLGRTINLG